MVRMNYYLLGGNSIYIFLIIKIEKNIGTNFLLDLTSKIIYRDYFQVTHSYMRVGRSNVTN